MKYRDRSLFGKRSYELLDAAIQASGSTTGGSRFEVQLAYAELNPVPEKIWLRSPMVWAGFMTTSGASLALGALSVFHPLEQDKTFLTGCAYTIAFIGLFLVAISLRKIELARFKSRGGAVALDILKSGPDKSQFDAFVAELKDRIKRAEKNGLSEPSGSG